MLERCADQRADAVSRHDFDYMLLAIEQRGGNLDLECMLAGANTRSLQIFPEDIGARFCNKVTVKPEEYGNWFVRAFRVDTPSNSLLPCDGIKMAMHS